MTQDKEQKSKDILERAMAGEDRALWARIGAQARAQIRMKRLAIWGMVTAALLLVLCAAALIGLNGARAGRDGWLARVFMPVLEARIYRPPTPGEAPGFLPIRVDDATWRTIEDNTEAVLLPYLPMGLPEGYHFMDGSIRQPDRDTIDMALRYEIDGRAFCIQYQYRYGACPDIDTDGAGLVDWDGTGVYLWEGAQKAVWREEDVYTLISIEGDISAGEMEDVYRCIEAFYQWEEE